MNKRMYGWAILLIILAVGCGKKDDTGTQGRPGMGGRSGGQKAAIPVQVASVVRGDISLYLLHTSTIEAEKEVDVVAKVSGQVVKLPAEEGMRVRKGQLLAQLDEAELKIDLLQARVKMETDQSAYERAKSMLEKNLISEETFETTRLQYENSKAAYEAARLRMQYTSIVSPIDGIVTARHIELGQRVNVNQVLFRVADFSPLRARIYVPEKDMGRIFEGQTAIITADALPGEKFIGVVRMVSPVVDPTNGTVKVTIDITNSKGKLKPGMFASVYITTEKHANTLLMPKRALLLESQTDQVFVYDNGIARKRTLKLGFVSGDTVEVLDGLREGDLVVVIGQEGLREGLPIRIPGQEVTQAPAKPGERQPGARMAAKAGDVPAQAKARPKAADGGKRVDPKEVERIENVFMQSRFFKRAFENRLQEDPELANDPAKKMAFFREFIQRMEDRVMQNPMIVQEFEKRVQEDPELETDLAKKMTFFQEMFRKMRRMR
ncbi:MAG: efflux RND transporter periplasmic adaptor subunit [candidate division KSB1 bacterium]|nr:efflux RND transporter periplasmic adaptor subunit [candidate division KSB1 bacterium]MDQ7066499.1 efflux RND transporter periplasmic adaptor subunit [candidate division KSB1 bacterium]